MELSKYARVFDETSPNWQHNPEFNRIFIELQQNYANHRLRAFGHLFLNEVYDMLGLPRTSEGQLVGWVWINDANCYVDFDLQPRTDDTDEKSGIQLDFNVQGVIYEKI